MEERKGGREEEKKKRFMLTSPILPPCPQINYCHSKEIMLKCTTRLELNNKDLIESNLGKVGDKGEGKNHK